MKNFKGFINSILIGIMFAIGGWLLCPMAQGQSSNSPAPADPTGLSTAKVQRIQYAPHQVIVNFKDTLTESASGIFAARKPFKQATSDKSDSLDKLIAKHKVKKITPVFRHENNSKKTAAILDVTTLKAQEKEKFQRIKDQRLSHLSQKAGQPVDLPELYHIYSIELKDGVNIEEALKDFAQDSHVEFVQPNFVVEANSFPETLPNDTYVDPIPQTGNWTTGAWGQLEEDLWGLKKIKVNDAWQVAQGVKPGGQSVVVAVVDTGLDYNHPDIFGNIWENQNEITGNGIDDDQNGYADDSQGWDFTTCTILTATGCVAKNPDNDPKDGQGHGTHVSGTIAAVGNNQLGIIGVAPQAKIMPLKALADNGSGFITELAAAIVYAAENGADVINNSWGCSTWCPSSPVVEEAVRLAQGLGAVVVFAAGNSSDDVRYYSPVNMGNDGPVVVGASTPTDQPTYFSNYGMTLDVLAPGGGDTMIVPPVDDRHYNILSLRAAAMDYLALTVGGDYLRLAGTSMAAPHISGVAALIRAHHPEFTPNEVRQVLRMSADDLSSPGFDLITGFGRVNAAAALQIDDVPHLEITSPTAYADISASNSEIEIRGTANAENFQSYQLFYGQGNEPTEWMPIGNAVYSPVAEGVLGNWNISSLADWHLLKLVLTTRDNKQFQTLVPVNITIPNRPPVFQSFNDIYEVNEGQGIDLGDAVVCDPENDKMTASMSSNPAKFTGRPFQYCVYVWDGSLLFREVCESCAHWNWDLSMPDYDDAGQYLLNFFADDGHGHVVTQNATLIVHNINRCAPGFSKVPPWKIDAKEGEKIIFEMIVQDCDLGDILIIKVEGLPAGAVLEKTSTTADSATYQFEWTPSFQQAGTYPMTYTANDGHMNGLTGRVTIVVAGVNRPPVWKTISPQTLFVGRPFTLDLSAYASDPDGESLTYSYGPVLANSGITPEGVFSWNPTAAQAGDQLMTFTVTDHPELLTANQIVKFHVINDITPPTGGISINSNALATNNVSVLLTLFSEDPESGVASMQFSNDGTNWSASEDVAETKSWDLAWGLSSPITDGEKTAYVKFTDGIGNESVYSDKIIFDTTRPSIGVSGIDSSWHNTDVVMTLTPSDSGSGVDKSYYSLDGSHPSIEYLGPVTISAEGSHLVSVFCVDKAGNQLGIRIYRWPVKIDKTAPTGTATAFYNKTDGMGLWYDLNLSATDSGSGMGAGAQIAIQFIFNNGLPPSAWVTQNYASTIQVLVTDGTATQLGVKFKDVAGNWSTPIPVDIPDKWPPTVTITSPADNATVRKGKETAITATAMDNVGVKRVDFYVDNVLVSSDTTAPYSYAWSVPNKPKIEYRLQAKSYDAGENVGISSPVTVTAK